MSFAQAFDCSDCSSDKKTKTRTISRLVAILLAAFVLSLAGSAVAQTVTVWTDQTDYPPGDSVVIFGSGYLPNEDVEVQITHYLSAIPDTGDGHDPWVISADGNGDFETYWIIPYDDQLDETLKVTATGLTSGWSAWTTFADASTILYATTVWADTICPSDPGSPDSINVCAILEQQCGGSGYAPLPGRELIFFFSNTNCGVDIAQTGEDTSTTDINGEACGYLEVPSAPGNYRIRVKFRGEDKPGPGDPPNSACIPGEKIKLSNANVCEPIIVDPVACCELGLTCPPDVTIECNESTDPSNTGTATYSGTCSGVAVTYSDATTPGTCANDYTITRTWIADNGTIADTCYQTITVQDTQAPLLAGCPTDITVECDAIPLPATVTATDNCDASPTVTFAETETPGACGNAKTITRTWTATDACGNDAVCAQVITVQDTQAPLLAGCPTDITVECDAIPLPASVTATDNCDASPTVTFNETETPGACGNAKTITRTWTATDACGNDAVCTQVITVQDTQAPLLAGCPTDITVECDAIPLPATVTATDNCDASPTVTFNETETPGACGNAKTITRTWTATDACGNDAVCTQVITVQDTQAPLLAGCPTDITVECDAIPLPASVTATDNCDASPTVTFNETEIPGACANAKTITRTWTATDACGNDAVCTQVITVQDTQAPLLAGCPTDITVECDAIPLPASVTATDNCDASPTVTFNETETPGINPGEKTITRSWTATDACGNDASCTQVITVHDSQAPLFDQSCPADVAGACDAVPTASTLTATDNCGTATVVMTETTTAGGCSGSYTITRTWTATDLSGNAAQCIQVITVNDNVAPVFDQTCPADAIVSCDAVPSAATVTATDNCGTATVTFAESTVAGSCAQESIITRTWTATDDCGNSNQCVQVLTVQDNSNPVCSVPTDTTVYMCDASEVCLPIGCTDVCDPNPTISIVSGPGTISGGNWCYTPSVSEVASVTVICMDACGNSCTSSFNVTFEVNNAPVCVVPNDTTIFQCAPAEVCLPVGCSDPDGNLSSGYPTIVSGPGTISGGNWCYTPSSNESVAVVVACVDDCGASSQCTFNVTFEMNQPPVCSVPGDQAIFQCTPTMISLPVGCTDPDGNGNAPTLLSGPGAIVGGNWEYTPAGTETAVVTIECEDQCGRTSQCTFSVEFVVNSAPSIVSCPGDLNVHWGAYINETVTATDSDGDATITFSLGAGSPGSINATTGAYTWTTSGSSVCGGDVVVIATDDCGIADSCEFNICVYNNPPVMTCADPAQVCWGSTLTGQATATDTDGGPSQLFYSVLSFNGPGVVTIDGVTGEYSWVTEQTAEYAGTFELCIGVSDNANTCSPCSPSNADTCCVLLTAVPAYQVHIEKTHGTLQGHIVDVAVYLDSSITYLDMGGFDFLVGYDASALTFMGAQQGQMLTDCGWEYFTYRFGADGNCDNGGCPSGELRIVAIAETNNGANHPNCRSNDGVSSVLATLSFLVSNNRTLECNYVPIRFHWYECSDNTISSPGGDTLYLASNVYDYQPSGGSEYVDITNTTSGFPTYTGAYYTCELDPEAKFAALRCLAFYNGGVDIVCADSIDARGDINLDGLAYTISDAVMYINYFIHGLSSFVDVADTNSYGYAPGYEGSVAASDVNADGLVLTVSDMVYLIRVIVGDALPYPKITPLEVNLTNEKGVLHVEGEMGAAYLMVRGVETPKLLANNVDMKYGHENGNTRIIVYSMNTESFTGDFVRISGDLISIEMATYEGQPTFSKLLPNEFRLDQNYPNPFNPTTKISFRLPTATAARLQIFNVQGQVVETLVDRVLEAGTHEYTWDAPETSSGIYFYRLETEQFSETRKMILLK